MVGGDWTTLEGLIDLGFCELMLVWRVIFPEFFILLLWFSISLTSNPGPYLFELLNDSFVVELFSSVSDAVWYFGGEPGGEPSGDCPISLSDSSLSMIVLVSLDILVKCCLYSFLFTE